MPTERIIKYYNLVTESDRFSSPVGKLEFERTKILIQRLLSHEQIRILDLGGGTGAYSFWLSQQGHLVWLVDPAEEQIRIATEKNKQVVRKLQGIILGYAEQLEFAGGSFDLVLNMGPMYHLTQRASRLEVLRKIHYVLKPAGLLCSTYISRFASLLDGYREGYIKDPVFVNLIREDLKSGMHNPDPESTKYFTEAYFHHPLEVESELSAAGFGQHRMFAVEGFAWLLQSLQEQLADPGGRDLLFEMIGRVESDQTLMGISAHILTLSKKI